MSSYKVLSICPVSRAAAIADRYLHEIQTREIQLPPLVEQIISNASSAQASWFENVETIVKDIYTRFMPLSQYTRDTDDRHFQLVAVNLKQLYLDTYSKPAPDFLVLAAFLHDLERWLDHNGDGNKEGAYIVRKLGDLVSKTDVSRKELERLDESLRKTVIHPIASMRLANHFMAACQVPEDILQKVLVAIRFHDADPAQISETVVHQAFPKLATAIPIDSIRNDILALEQADAMVFFQTTIGLFLADRFKDATITDETLERRLSLNFKKVGPAGLQKAFEYGLSCVQETFKYSNSPSSCTSNDSGVFKNTSLERATRMLQKVVGSLNAQ